MDKATPRNLEEAQIFTPPHITRQMLELLVRENLSADDTYFFEPSCGDGEMLLVILEEIHAELLKKYDGDYNKAIADTLFKFHAIELDPALVVKCRTRVFEFFGRLMEHCNAESLLANILARQIHAKIENKDFFEFMGATNLSTGLKCSKKDCGIQKAKAAK